MRPNFDCLVQGASDAGAALAPGAAGPLLGIAISCVGRRLVLGERTEGDARRHRGHRRQAACANRRFAEMYRVPPEAMATGDDALVLEMVLEQLTDPEAFRARVAYLHEHPLEVSLDELQLRDGRILERFTGPVLSAQGVDYGRIWTFRDDQERAGIAHHRGSQRRCRDRGGIGMDGAYRLNRRWARLQSRL